MSDDAPHTQPLGAHGEPCPACGAPLASDQRYCLNCGRRRAGARVPYADLLAGRAPEEVLSPAAAPPPPASPSPGRTVSAGLALAGAGGVALVLAVGVLIGAAATNEEPPRQVAAAPAPQRPPVINVNAGTPVAATEEEFVSDWPGDEGWTVQLEALPKDGTEVSEVDEAKSDAEAQGADEVGALDSGEWASLKPGQYVVYSGVFTGEGAKGKAQAAAKRLKKDFPEAKAVEVSAGDIAGAQGTRPEEKVRKVDESELQELESATGEEQQKKSARLPETLGLEGEPPPTDKEEPGAGSDTQVIE